MRGLVVIVLVAFALSACSQGEDEARDSDEQARIFSIRSVRGMASAPCKESSATSRPTTLPARSDRDRCYELGSAVVTASDVAKAGIVEDFDQPGHWTVGVNLTRHGARRLGSLLRSATGSQVAIVVAGTVATTPTAQPTEERAVGVIAITGAYEEDEAVRIAARISGRSPSRVERTQVSDDSRRALAVCESYRASIGASATVLSSAPNTAGKITQIAAAAGEDPGVWATLPEEHFVASCSYDPTGDSAATAPIVECPDGDHYSTFEPTQLLVDEESNASPDFEIPPALQDPCT